MPLGSRIACKGPFGIGPRQPRQDVWITEEIQRIIQPHKAKIPDWKIDGECGKDQEKTNKCRLAKQMKLAGLSVHNKMKTNGLRDCKSDYWIIEFGNS